jgi:hypothetical protein
MGSAFVILFPLGATIIRFLAPYLPAPARLHYGLQTFTFLSVLAAMGLGIYLSKDIQFHYFRTLPSSHFPKLTPRSNLWHHYH